MNVNYIEEIRKKLTDVTPAQWNRIRTDLEHIRDCGGVKRTETKHSDVLYEISHSIQPFPEWPAEHIELIAHASANALRAGVHHEEVIDTTKFLLDHFSPTSEPYNQEELTIEDIAPTAKNLLELQKMHPGITIISRIAKLRSWDKEPERLNELIRLFKRKTNEGHNIDELLTELKKRNPNTRSEVDLAILQLTQKPYLQQKPKKKKTDLEPFDESYDGIKADLLRRLKEEE